MPTATLRYRLPDERDEYEAAYYGGTYRVILSELDQYLRSRIKYEDLPEPVGEALQLARQRLHDLAMEYGVEIL
jgi:hypothetical protein